MAAPDDSDELTPAARPDTLREVDWLALAPWLELLEGPRLVFASGAIVLAAIGVILVGGAPPEPPAPPWDARGLAASAAEGLAALPLGIVAPFVEVAGAETVAEGLRTAALGVARLAVWAWLGLVMADRVAVTLASGPRGGLGASLRRGTTRLPRLAAVLFVAAAPAALVLLYLLPRLTYNGLTAGYEPVAVMTALVWWFLLALSLGLAVLVLGFAVGAPLLWAAIAVDDSDAFDATSRMYAYATQRVARFAFYGVVAAVAGFAAGLLVELLASSALAIAHLGFPTGESEFGHASALGIARWWEGLFLGALRGFYPAYFFTASVLVYLQLRRDIDGQPTDEIGDR